MRTTKAISILTRGILAASLGSIAWSADWWQVAIVDNTANVGEYSSLKVLPSGMPAVSYYDNGQADVRYAAFNGTLWVTTIMGGDTHCDGKIDALDIKPLLGLLFEQPHSTWLGAFGPRSVGAREKPPQAAIDFLGPVLPPPVESRSDRGQFVVD